MKGQAILITTAFVALLVLLTVYLVFQQGSLRANVAIREPIHYKIMYIIESRTNWTAEELAEKIIKETYCSAVEVNITIINLSNNNVILTDYVSPGSDDLDLSSHSLVAVDYTQVLVDNRMIIYHVKAYRLIG